MIFAVRVSVFLALGVSSFAADGPPKLRLSEVEKIEPKNYRAELALDPDQNTFSGKITIRMEVGEPTNTIWLNQNNIRIQSATIAAAGKTQKAEVVSGGDDFVGLRVATTLPLGGATAAIEYTGVIVERNSNAIFRQQDGGNWYLFTQFEATDARGAYPCFDEPSFKTPWQLTLRIPEKYSAISNTKVASERSAAGKRTVVFRETKPLPSYLTAFAVGPFEYVNAGTIDQGRVPVRIVVPKGRSGEAKYAAEVTATILSRLEGYFGIPYPYDKADQVAVPNFGGAMENPGMVTYDQSFLLSSLKSDSITRQRQYALVATHELAHQWFGDMVTTAWWDDIWLNEAFATWLERKVLAEWKPEWKTRVEDMTDTLKAERTDSLISARKIRQEILTKDDINNAFDGITYNKGAAVIGMFENWMGPDAFRKGVQGYMKQYAFRATTAGQFLDSLSTSSKQNVSVGFSTFLNQAGLPVISIALECKGGKAAVHVEQKRSLPLGSRGSTGQVWKVPLCIRYGAGTDGQKQCTLLTERTETIALQNTKSCPAWVQANDGAAGYYRVDYHGGLLAALIQGDVERRLNGAERADLLGNTLALTNAGMLPVSEALKLAGEFRNDSDRTALQTAISLALAPSNILPDSLTPNYQRYLQTNFQARAREYGWLARSDESEDSKLLRPQLVGPVAMRGGDERLAAEAKDLADKWLSDPATLDPNIVGAVLSAAAFHGDRALAERFLETLGKTTDKQARLKILQAMQRFRDPAAIEECMQALLNGKVPFIEGADLLFLGQETDATRKMALQFLKSNWDQIVAKMPSGGIFDLGAFLPHVGRTYCDVESRDELKSFLAPKIPQLPGMARNLDQVVESIDLCIAEKAAQGSDLAKFLATF